VARAITPPPDDPAEALSAAYTRGLRLLGGRELSEPAVRQRLAAAGYLPSTIDAAVDRLRQTGALDERRALAAVARTIVQVKRRGRLRAQRELEARGFSREAAAEALAGLLSADDERVLVERALDARLRGRLVRTGDVAAMRRLQGALLRQGFPPGLVRDAVRNRFRNAPRLEDDAIDE
jgi:regulatory protein